MWYVNTRPGVRLGVSVVWLCELRTVVREHLHHKSTRHRRRCLGAISRRLFVESGCRLPLLGFQFRNLVSLLVARNQFGTPTRCMRSLNRGSERIVSRRGSTLR